MRKFNKALSVLLIIAILLGAFSPSTPYLSEKLWHRNEQSAQLQTFSEESNEEVFVVLYNENGEIIQPNTAQQPIEYGEYLVNLVGFVPNSPISYGAEVYVNVGGDCTTTVVSRYTNALGIYDYAYDGNGYITHEWFTPAGQQYVTQRTDYTYDQWGQLTQAAVYTDLSENAVPVYSYNYTYSNGNITQKTYAVNGGTPTEFNLSYNSTGNWKDQAVSINGENIVYDVIGNPEQYRGATLTWENGRQLKSYTKDGQTISFGYDAEGKRIKKTLPNGVYYEYIYSDGILTSVKSSDFGVNFTYITDESGNYIGFKNYNTMYYFVRNLQNDVVAITDANGNVIVRYEYDPWGVPTIIAEGDNYNIGYANMIRYRGYFYDVETGLYYLQSRYYDPSTGRFINADGFVSTGQGIIGSNMYAYCGNNPVNRFDPTGNSWLAIAAALITLAITVIKGLSLIKESNRVFKELDDTPAPTKDITEELTETMQTNAKTIHNSKKEDGIVDASLLFYNNVRNKGVWDLKQNPEYQGTFSFNNMVVEGQDIGNINFGYTGAALGLPICVLLSGAGYAQIRAGTYEPTYIFASNGDDLRDQIYIIYGAILYYGDAYGK